MGRRDQPGRQWVSSGGTPGGVPGDDAGTN